MAQGQRLENRIRTLEHEVKVLKNQIQQTLLDIQMQIMTHYYPSLHAAEDEEPAGGYSPAPRRQEAPAPPATPATSPVAELYPPAQVPQSRMAGSQPGASAPDPYSTDRYPVQQAPQGQDKRRAERVKKEGIDHRTTNQTALYRQVRVWPNRGGKGLGIGDWGSGG